MGQAGPSRRLQPQRLSGSGSGLGDASFSEITANPDVNFYGGPGVYGDKSAPNSDCAFALGTSGGDSITLSRCLEWCSERVALGSAL